MKKILLLIPLIAVVLVSACTQQPTGQVIKEAEPSSDKEVPALVTLNIGESATTNRIQVTILSAKKELSYKYYSEIWERYVEEQVDPEHIFIIADVEIKNIGDDTEYVGSTQISGTDSEGYKYDTEFYYGENQLSIYESLYPNQKIKGKILFKIPVWSKGFEIIYDFSNFFTSLKLAKWKVS